MNKLISGGRGRHSFWRRLRKEVQDARRYQQQTPPVRFSRREKLSIVLIFLMGLLAALIASYLFAHYKGKILEI